MAGEKKYNNSEPVVAKSKSASVTKLPEQYEASGKDGIPSCSSSTSMRSSSGVAPSSVKGYNSTSTQINDQSYFQISDASHAGIQQDNGSVLYYIDPYGGGGFSGYDAYGGGMFVGHDGQYVTTSQQQPYASSSGYVQQSVSYGSEVMPMYSWDPQFVGGGDDSSAYAAAAALVNAHANSAMASNGFKATKPNGTTTSTKLSNLPLDWKSRHYAAPSSNFYHPQHPKHLNKASLLASNFQSEIDYDRVRKFASSAYEKQAPFTHSSLMNTNRLNGQTWSERDGFRFRESINRNKELGITTELTCGPRAINKSMVSNASPSEKDQWGLTARRDQYNSNDFETEYENAKFYVIKSYSEDNIHRCIKYGVWASTPYGNKKLDNAFHDVEAIAKETGKKIPIFLFFSVNGSGQFVGVAEMMGQVDFNKDMDFWQLDKWNGFFPVQWHIIKDIPNSQLRHIILENNDSKPVTFTRDTQEVGLKQGVEMLNIFKSYSAKSSMLDDFNFYETREKTLKARKITNPSHMEKYRDGDFPISEEVGVGGGRSRSSDIVELTKNLTLNANAAAAATAAAAASPQKNLTIN